MRVVIEDDIPEDFEPSEEEVNEYSKWLGMDLPTDQHLLWIAREGIKAPLPDDWKPCKSSSGDIYYFNFRTGDSRWEHPQALTEFRAQDDFYKELYRSEREKALRKSKSATASPTSADASNTFSLKKLCGYRTLAGEVKEKLKDALAEAESAQLSSLTRAAVEATRSVLGTPEGLTRVFMRDDEAEILSVLRAHNSKIFKSKGEESTEVLEATKLRDATYAEYLAASKNLSDACSTESGLIGRVQERNEATKACVDVHVEMSLREGSLRAFLTQAAAERQSTLEYFRRNPSECSLEKRASRRLNRDDGELPESTSIAPQQLSNREAASATVHAKRPANASVPNASASEQSKDVDERHRTVSEESPSKDTKSQSRQLLETRAELRRLQGVLKAERDGSTESGLIGRVQERHKATKACVDGLYQLLDESVVVITAMNQPQDPSTATRTVAETLSLHDDWVASKLVEEQELRAKVKEAMTNLALSLKAHSEVLLHCDDPPKATAHHKEMDIPEDTTPLKVVLRERIAAKETWLAGIARDHQSKVSPALICFARVAISELHSDLVRFDVLISAAAECKKAATYGENPHERVKRDLSGMSSSIRTASRAVRNAKQSIKNAEEDRNDKDRAHWEQQLSNANKDLSKLQLQELNLWSDVYRLASAAFPELPSQALKLFTSRDGTLSLIDPNAARLLATTRQKDMYQGPNGELGPIIISNAGIDSRNDVFRAVYNDNDVCLKKFVLGRMSKGRKHEELHVRVRTLQREINNVVKLAHDRVIKPALFFLQAEDNGSSLCAYVEYPWYPCGSMDTWLKTLPAEGTDSPKVRVVLWDVIKAIEHVHYHGIVHCDIKLANVLIELHSDGQHRGVLADFDLSKDLELRRREASMSVMSVAGARGTAGCLTMAPEVLHGGQPDFTADCYSFGGMMPQTLFKSESDSWQQGGDEKRWDIASGAPLLTMVKDEKAHSLLSQALHRDKGRRPTSTQIVSHGFFSADISRAQDLLQDLEKGREELERKQADHSEAVRDQRNKMSEEKMKLTKEQDVLKADLNVIQAQLQREQEDLERRERKLADQGKLNQDEEKKLHDDRKRLETERNKMSKEKMKHEQELQKQQQKLDQRVRDEEAKLAADRKKIEDQLQREQEDLERRERKLADQGKLNQDEEKKLHDDRKRLETESNKMSEEKMKREQERQKQQQKLDQRVRDEEAKLASDRKVIEDWKKELKKKEMEASKVLQVPLYWQNKTGIHFVTTNFVRDALQNFMIESSCCLKKIFAAQGIHSLSTATNWQPVIPSTIVAEMSTDINEFYLIHGTSSTSAQIICEHGFDERVAKLDGLYGAGSYFAINSCKSHQYSLKYKDSPTVVMLVCRVVMGSPYCTSTSHINQRRPPDNAATPGWSFDSIFAQQGIAHGGLQHHNEYVVFDRYQVYPEYIVQYTV